MPDLKRTEKMRKKKEKKKYGKGTVNGGGRVGSRKKKSEGRRGKEKMDTVAGTVRDDMYRGGGWKQKEKREDGILVKGGK